MTVPSPGGGPAFLGYALPRCGAVSRGSGTSDAPLSCWAAVQAAARDGGKNAASNVDPRAVVATAEVSCAHENCRRSSSERFGRVLT